MGHKAEPRATVKAPGFSHGVTYPFEQLDFAHFSAPSLNEQKPAGLSGLQTEMVGYLSVR